MKNRIRMLWVVIGLAIITGPSMTHAYEVGEVQKGGTIQGQVTFLGSPPVPVQFKVDKNPEVCGQERSLMKVDAQNGFLTGAVVVLEGVEKGKPFLPQTLAGTAPGEGTFQHQGGELPGPASPHQRLQFWSLYGCCGGGSAHPIWKPGFHQTYPAYLCGKGSQGKYSAHRS